MTERGRIGIRELRQNLSGYLRRALAGDAPGGRWRLPGRPAHPISEHADRIARLAAEGRITPAKRRLEELGPPLEVDVERPLSDVLEKLRKDTV